MNKVKVKCYSGYRADERPILFVLDDRQFIVEKINKLWRTPDFEYFEVFAGDERMCLLKHDMKNNEWLLEWIKNK